MHSIGNNRDFPLISSLKFKLTELENNNDSSIRFHLMPLSCQSYNLLVVVVVVRFHWMTKVNGP